MSWECSSQFRRSGQRDERRRRLFADESAGGTRQQRRRRQRAAESDGAEPSPHYTDAAMQQQPRVTDLVPQSLWVHGLLAALGAAAIAGLLALHDRAAGSATASNLLSPGSLADWFTSTLLLTAAVLCVLIYSVRRHRTDDYHGRYHIWLWAALCLALISVDATADLRVWFQQAMMRITGTGIAGDGAVWWAVPYACVLAAVGSRLLIDVFPARLPTAGLSTAAGCLILATATRLGWLRPGDETHTAMLQAGATLSAVWLLTVGLMLNARYVMLDAEGLIPLPEPKPRKADSEADSEIDQEREARLLRLADADTSDADDEEDGEQWIAVEAPRQSTQPVLRRRAAKSDEPDVEAASPVGRKLTKQEKKALKRKLMREQAQRQRDQQRKWAS